MSVPKMESSSRCKEHSINPSQAYFLVPSAPPCPTSVPDSFRQPCIERRAVKPGTHRRRAAIATLLTVPRTVGRRRFACAGGTSAIRIIEHVAPHVHPAAPCHYMSVDAALPPGDRVMGVRAGPGEM